MDKSRLMMIVIIALLVILIGTVVGTTLFLLSGNDPDPDIFAEAPDPIHHPQRTSLMDMVEVSLGERFQTNLATGADGRVAMVIAEVVVGMDGDADVDELGTFIMSFNARLGMARSVIIQEFGNAHFEDVNTPEGQLELAETMTRALREQFESNLILRVFFSDWTVQRGR